MTWQLLALIAAIIFGVVAVLSGFDALVSPEHWQGWASLGITFGLVSRLP